VTASDGVEGLELVSRHVIQPDLSLADYNLSQHSRLHFNKPVKVGDLIGAIEGLIAGSRPPTLPRTLASGIEPVREISSVVYVVDDDQYCKRSNFSRPRRRRSDR
jgi:two-component system CheB/CheR fusion protein